MARAYGVPSRRKRVVELLTEAFAKDELEQAEFEQRVERAERARTIDELDDLIADFPEQVVKRELIPGTPTPALGGTPLAGPELQREIDRLDGLAAPTRISFLGDQHVSVVPGDPAVVRSVNLLGDCDIDLRGLSGVRGAFLVKVAGLIGDTRIIVPRGTNVEFRLFSLLGDQKRIAGGGPLKRLLKKLGLNKKDDDTPHQPPGPTVVITGVNLIGDTQVFEV